MPKREAKGKTDGLHYQGLLCTGSATKAPGSLGAHPSHMWPARGSRAVDVAVRKKQKRVKYCMERTRKATARKTYNQLICK